MATRTANGPPAHAGYQQPPVSPEQSDDGLPPPNMPQKSTGQPPPIQIPPLPKYSIPEAPRIKFNGQNYIFVPKIEGKDFNIHPSGVIQVTTLIMMTLRYGIPALAGKCGLDAESISLNDLKLIQKVKQDNEAQGKVILEYTDPKTKQIHSIEITDDLVLNVSGDQEKVCGCFPQATGTCSCHTNHKTAKSTYALAIDILRQPSFSVNQNGEMQTASYSDTLNILKYSELAESYRTKYPENSKKEETSTKTKEKPEAKPEDESKNPKSAETDPKTANTQEKPKNEPIQETKQDGKSKPEQSQSPIPETQSQVLPAETTNIFDKRGRINIEALSDGEKQLANIPIIGSRESAGSSWWKEYLLNGKLLTVKDDKAAEKDKQTVQPLKIDDKKRLREILEKLRFSREKRCRSLIHSHSKIGLEWFNEPDEQIFMKRLILLIAKLRHNDKKDYTQELGHAFNSLAPTAGYQPVTFLNDDDHPEVKELMTMLYESADRVLSQLQKQQFLI